MILFSSEAISDIKGVRNFLAVRNPDPAARANRAIWQALERVERFPEIEHFTKNRSIRQIIVQFGRCGYAVRSGSAGSDNLRHASPAWPRGAGMNERWS